MYPQIISDSSYCNQLGLYQPNYLQSNPADIKIPLNLSAPASTSIDTASFMNFMLFMYMMKNSDKFMGINSINNEKNNSSTNINSYKNTNITSHSRKTTAVEDVEDVEETEPISETDDTKKAEKAEKAEESKKAEEAKKAKEAEEKAEKEKAVKALETSQKKAQEDFDKSKKQQGFIGKSWNWMKNTLGASSEKVKEEEIEGKGGFGHWCRKTWSKVVDSDNGTKAIQKKMDDSKEKIKEAKKDPAKLEEAYTKVNNDVDKYEDIFLKGKKNKELTEEEKTCFEEIKKELGDKGLDVSRKDLRKAIQSAINKGSETTVEKQIIAKSEDTEGEGLKLNTAQKVEDFKSSQEAGVDTIASIANGLIIAAAIAASPFTFGASLAIAIPAGAALKVGIKYLDCKTAEEPKDYDSLGSDLLTGSIDGFAAAIFPGGSSAITTSAAKTLGLQATKVVTKKVATETAETVAKETAENLVKNSAKGSWLKNLFLKPTFEVEGELVGKTVNKLTGKGITRAQDVIGQVISKDAKLIAQDATEKTLGTVTKAAQTDGKTLITSTIDDISRAEARKIGFRNSTRNLAKKGITESVEYGTKDAKHLPGMLLNAIDKTSAGREFVAKGLGQTITGGGIGSVYAGSNSIGRGDDLMTVLENTGNGFKAGLLFGGATFAGSKILGGTINKFGSKTPNEALIPEIILENKPPMSQKPIIDIPLYEQPGGSWAAHKPIVPGKFLPLSEQKFLPLPEQKLLLAENPRIKFTSQEMPSYEQMLKQKLDEAAFVKQNQNLLPAHDPIASAKSSIEASINERIRMANIDFEARMAKFIEESNRKFDNLLKGQG
ncbi:MAG: hypothetical protein WCF95_02490 [bacterium]